MKIFESLCSKDKRNPAYSDIYDEDDTPKARKDCFCDNCFYGSDKMALDTIALMEGLKDAIDFIDDLEMSGDGFSPCQGSKRFQAILDSLN